MENTDKHPLYKYTLSFNEVDMETTDKQTPCTYIHNYITQRTPSINFVSEAEEARGST